MNSKAEDAAMSFFIKYPLKNRNIKRGWNSYQTPIYKYFLEFTYRSNGQ